MVVALLLTQAPRAQRVATQTKVTVATPDEFKTALEKRAGHIVITQHMDLTVFTENQEVDGELAAATVLEKVKNGTFSIVGACQEPFSTFNVTLAHPLLPQRPGQCLLLLLTSLLDIQASSFWMHNVYLRSVAITRTPSRPTLYAWPYGMLVASSSDVWLSRVTFQGELPPSYANVSADDVSELALGTVPVSMGAIDEVDGDGQPTRIFMTGCRSDAFLAELRVKFGSLATESCVWSNMLTPVLSVVDASSLALTGAQFIDVVPNTAAAGESGDGSFVNATAVISSTAGSVFGDDTAAKAYAGALAGTAPAASSVSRRNGTFVLESDEQLEAIRAAWDSLPYSKVADIPDQSNESSTSDTAVLSFEPPTETDSGASSPACSSPLLLLIATLCLTSLLQS